MPLSISVPAPVLLRAPLPLITPLSVRAVPAVSTWKAPVPPVASANSSVLEALAPVYSKVPLVPLLPNVTAVALLPNTPLALALLIVPMDKVPD